MVTLAVVATLPSPNPPRAQLLHARFARHVAFANIGTHRPGYLVVDSLFVHASSEFASLLAAEIKE